MTKQKIDLTNRAAVLEHMASLEDVQSVLENSALIYSSDIPLKKDVLENIIRYDDLSMEQLSNEYRKVKGLIEHALTNHIPVSEYTQNYLMDMLNLVGSRMTNYTDTQHNINRLMLGVYEHDLADVDMTRQPIVRDCASDYVTESVDMMKDMYDSNTLSAHDILESCNILFSGAFAKDTDEYNVIKNSMFDKIKTTLKCEMNNDNFCDLPVMKCLGYVRNEVKTTYCDKPDILADVDSVFDDLCDDLEDMLSEFYLKVSCEDGMSPDPFNVYNLTPFPVGVRTVTSTIMDIAAAETDEQIEEALNNFGRLMTVCETFGEEILTEKRGFVAKKAREISRTSKKEVGGKLHDAAKKTGDVAVAAKKTVDPMAKFIESMYAKIKKADTEERRNLIIKGNIVPKITRWIKRAITLGVVSALTNPIIAGIGLLTYIATDKHFDRKEKAKIIRELKSELEIVEEKIEDARGDENKQNKYELMRIRTKLKKDIERIEFGVKYN